jgi:hypothetical protein
MQSIRSSSAILVDEMRHTAGIWRAFLWFALNLVGAAAVSSLAIAFLHRAPPIPSPAPSDAEIRLWVPVVVDAPGTAGAPRTYRQVGPKQIRQAIEAVSADKLGHILFNPPEHMTTGQEEPIDAAITLGDVEAAIRKFIGKEKVTEAQLAVSSRMRVKLLGEDFKINEYSSEEQTVDIDKPFGPTLWNWRVTPVKPGRLHLTLRATRIMAVPKDGDVPRDLPSFERTIIVTANPWYSVGRWADDNEKWAIPLGVSLAAQACGWVIAAKLKPKRKRRGHRPNARFQRYRGT